MVVHEVSSASKWEGRLTCDEVPRARRAYSWIGASTARSRECSIRCAMLRINTNHHRPSVTFREDDGGTLAQLNVNIDRDTCACSNRRLHQQQESKVSADPVILFSSGNHGVRNEFCTIGRQPQTDVSVVVSHSTLAR